MRWCHATLRMCRAQSDYDDAVMACLSPSQEEAAQALSELGENARRKLAELSVGTVYGKTREEWARQYELAQSESSTALQNDEGQNEDQVAEQGGDQAKIQDGGQIDDLAEDLAECKVGDNGEAHVVDHAEDHVEGRDGVQIHNHGAAHAEDHGEAHISDHGGQGENQ